MVVRTPLPMKHLELLRKIILDDVKDNQGYQTHSLKLTLELHQPAEHNHNQ